MRVTRLLGPVLASAFATAGLVLAPAAPATAAAGACPGASGVTVVVDFNELPAGAEIQVGCDRTPGGSALENFRDAGFTVTQRPSAQDFTCQIDGQPADRDCAATDAFWSLWTSDGKTGRWAFATEGVTTLRVPEGGYVAFAWHQGSGQAAPPDAVPTPRVPKATPTPTAAPSTKATAGAPSGGTKGGPKRTPSATPTPRATPTPSTSPSASRTPSATPTTSASPTAPSTATSSALPDVEDITAGPETDRAHTGDEDSSLGTWLAVGAGVGVLGVAGAVPLVRRRLG